MNVANKGIIRKITARFLKAGKTRNIIAVIAIALTAAMFTSVFTIGGVLISTTQEQTMRQVGTSSHGGLKYLTAEQYENFAQSPLIKDISYNKIFAFAENDALKKVQSEIKYSEDKMAKWGFSLPNMGKMPLAANEVACSTLTLDLLGVPHEIGASVPLEFTVGGRKYSEIFTLSGYWTGDAVSRAQQIWLSKEYTDTVLAENVIPQSDTAGKINADVWFGNSFDIENKVKQLIRERGYSANEESFIESYTDDVIDYGVNWAYAGSDADPASTAIAVFVLALILLSGYLIIYSIFIISVNADIHFYGLLKTIGTTGKQIRRIIRAQALLLSAFGIPAGLLFGYIGGVYLSPHMLNLLDDSYKIKVTANPLIFVFAAAFSLITVFIGCRKPGKIASRVSPVEAVKYSGTAGGGKKKEKKTHRIAGITMSMAWANVTREKRKLFMIITSLSLALILLNSAFSASSSFDMDAYLSNMIVGDFSVAHFSIFLNNSDKVMDGVTDDFLSEAEARGAEEISNVYNFYYFNFREDGQNAETYQIYGVGKKELEHFSDVDYEKLSSGNYAVVSEYVFSSYGELRTVVPEIGDIVTLANSNNADIGVPRDFEIIERISADDYELFFPLSNRMSFGNTLTIYIADNVFLDFFGDIQPMQSNIYMEDEKIAEFEEWLQTYIEKREPDLGYISRNTLNEEFDGVRTMYVTLGGAMAFIFALIGVLNFINAVVASIMARRRELAMLQSVGMTGKQTRNTLFFEGVCYTALTAFFTLTAGLGISRLIVEVIAGQVWFFKQNLTVTPSLYCVVPLFIICAVVPLVCYARLTRESLVERLRVE